MSMPELSAHVVENRRKWDEYAPQWVASGERLWASEPEWGVWGVPEAELGLLADDLRGVHAIELGCGTGYVSAWLRRYFGMRRIDWTEAVVDPGGIEFNLPIAEWMRLFREVGFDVVDYIEVQAPATATGQEFETPADWAKRWPAEHAWKLRKR